MGTAGTLGIGAIKERGGATFVQALSSAKFDGMHAQRARDEIQTTRKEIQTSRNSSNRRTKNCRR